MKATLDGSSLSTVEWDYVPRYSLLLVEDNIADVRLITMVIDEARVSVSLEILGNGADALTRLNRDANSKDELPHAMLVDLNLPRVDGFELLRQIKENPALSHIPIIIFSTSQRADDRERCLKSRASGFYTKPGDLEEFETLVRRLVEKEFPKEIGYDVH